MEKLNKCEVKMFTGAKVKEFKDDGVIYEPAGSQIESELLGFDTVVLAMGSKSYNPLEEKLKGKVKELYVIGEAIKAGKAITGIKAAAEVATKL